MFDASAIAEILKKNIDARNIRVNFATITSFGGTPLLEGVISISDVDAMIPLSKNDVISGLQSIVECVSEKLSLALDGREVLRARSLAFNCHNLANASVFIKRLQSMQ